MNKRLSDRKFNSFGVRNKIGRMEVKEGGEGGGKGKERERGSKHLD